MINSQFFYNQFASVIQSNLQLLSISEGKICDKTFWNIDSTGPVPIDVKFTDAFPHLENIVHRHINLFISLLIRKDYILINPYGYIQKYKVVK